MSADELREKVEAVRARFPVYAVMKTVTEKSVDERTGEIKEIPVPVIQFERLMGDLTWFLDTLYVQIDREKRFHPIKTPGDLLKAWPKLIEVLGGRLDFSGVIYDKEDSLKTLQEIQGQGIDAISLSPIEDPDLPRVDIGYAVELVKNDKALIAKITDEERFYLRLVSYNLEDDIYLPVELLKETGALVLDPRLPKVMPVGGRVDGVPWYYYPDVRLITDESYLRQNNLRFDIFVVGQGVGSEEEYPRSPVFNISGEYPALLQVSKGKCIFLLQLQDPDNPSNILETRIVEVGEKERVVIPHGCRFAIANSGNEPLIVAGWLSRDAKVSYTYEPGDNVEFQEKIAERLSPLSGISSTGIIWSRPIYGDIKSFRVDEILGWLNKSSIRKGAFYDPYESREVGVALHYKEDILKTIVAQIRSKEKILKEHKEFILTGLNRTREALQVRDITSLPIAHIFRDLKIVATEVEDSDLRDLCLVVITEFLKRLREDRERLTIEQLPEVFCGLFSYLIEIGPGRYETSYLLAVSEAAKREFGRINESMRRTRQLVVDVLADYFGRDEFRDIEVFIRREILPFLDKVANDPDCYEGLRAGLVAQIYDDLHLLKFRTENHKTRDLIDAIYARKYQRFGTSGVRARVGIDFNNEIAALIGEEIARFFKEESGLLDDKQRTIVIGYDTRKGADKYARICAAAAIMAGFKVQLFNHPIPTGALIQWAVKKVGFDNLAGIINCTPSHNPYPWVGIRVSPRYGGPAGTDLTEFITKRINERILAGDITEISRWKGWDEDDYIESPDIRDRFHHWKEEGVFEIIGDRQATKDKVAKPMEEYIDYAVELVKLVLGNEIQEEMADYYRDKKVVIDSMYGASQGYAEAILAKLGVPKENIVTVHGERNPDLLILEDGTRIPSDPGVGEFLAKTGTLNKSAEISMGGRVSVSGTALDTDGDRMAGFGVSEDGKTIWFTPNKIFTAITYYIITDRNTQDKDFIIAKSGPSTLWIDLILSKLKQDPHYSKRLVTPQELPIAGYEIMGNPEFRNPTYQIIHSEGDIPLVTKDLTEYLTDVGFKYVATTMLNGLDPKAAVMAGKKIQLAIGFEESAGFAIAIEEVDAEGNIYRLFVPDKDGLIATTLFYAIQAREKKGIVPIISDLERQFGQLNSERLDVIASTNVKVDIINSLLSEFSKGLRSEIAGFRVKDIQHIGGIYYDRFNLIFIDKKTNTPVTFKIRMSGTEPLVRIYIEARDKEILERFLMEAESLILECNIRAIENAPTKWSLVDLISLIELTEENIPVLQKAVQDRLQKGDMPEDESIQDIVERFITGGSLEEKYVGPRSKVALSESLRNFFRNIDDPIGSVGPDKPIPPKEIEPPEGEVLSRVPIDRVIGRIRAEYGPGIFAGVDELKLKEDGLLLTLGDEDLLYILLMRRLIKGIMQIIPCEDDAVRELTANYMSLKLALEKGISTRFLASLGMTGASLEALQAMAEVTDEDIIAVAIEHMSGMPYYEDLFRQFPFAEEWQTKIKDAENRYNAALRVFNEIAGAKQMAEKVKETKEKANRKIKGLSDVIKKIRMITSLWTVNTGFIDALLQENKYVMLDRDDLDEHIKEWIEKVTKGKKRSPFIYSDQPLPEGVSQEDVIYLIEPEKVKDGMSQDRLYLPLPYSISSIYLAGQVVLASGRVGEIWDKLALNTIRALYETLLGREVKDEELEQLFMTPWKVLPPIVKITSTLNALRKAIQEIEVAA